MSLATGNTNLPEEQQKEMEVIIERLLNEICGSEGIERRLREIEERLRSPKPQVTNIEEENVPSDDYVSRLNHCITRLSDTNSEKRDCLEHIESVI